MYLSVWIVGNDLFVRLIRLLQHANVCHRTSVSCRMQSKKCSHTSRLSTLHTEIHTKMRYNMIQSMTVCLRVISMTGVCEEHKHASLQMTWEEKRWCRKCKRRQMGTTCAHLIHHVFVGSQESLQKQLNARRGSNEPKELHLRLYRPNRAFRKRMNKNDLSANSLFSRKMAAHVRYVRFHLNKPDCGTMSTPKWGSLNMPGWEKTKYGTNASYQLSSRVVDE